MVSGTTCTTVGECSSTRCAVTTTTGRTIPASEPMGVPRSTRTTSPELGIKPLHLVVAERMGEFSTHLVLAEEADGGGDGLGDRRATLTSKPFQGVMGGPVDSNGSGVGHDPILSCRRRYLHTMLPIANET